MPFPNIPVLCSLPHTVSILRYSNPCKISRALQLLLTVNVVGVMMQYNYLSNSIYLQNKDSSSSASLLTAEATESYKNTRMVTFGSIWDQFQVFVCSLISFPLDYTFSNLCSPIQQNKIQSVNIFSLQIRIWKDLEYSAFCRAKHLISCLILSMRLTPLKRTELPTQLGPGQSAEPMKYWILTKDKLSWFDKIGFWK